MEGLKLAAPKHPEMLGRAIRHASHKEAFMLKQGGVQNSRWQQVPETC
jgi:hypothetical protein